MLRRIASRLPLVARSLIRRSKRAHRAKGRTARRPQLERLEHRELLHVGWRNPLDHLDINRDGSLTSNDALVIINELNGGGPRRLPLGHDPGRPFFDATGDGFLTPQDSLHVINYLNRSQPAQRDLIERSGDEVVQELDVTVGQLDGRRLYRLWVEPGFAGPQDVSLLPDWFSVYVVDPAQPARTLLDRGTSGTSIFSLSPLGYEVARDVARWDGQFLEIDFSSLDTISTARLRLQLLNGNGDASSRVRVRPVSNGVDPDRVPVASLSDSRQPVSAGAAVELATWTSSPSLVPTIRNVRYERNTGSLVTEIGVRNLGTPIGRNVALVFPQLPAGVTLTNRSGIDSQGRPYLNLQPAIRSGGLGGQADSALVEARFANPGRVPLTLTTQVLVGPLNQPPQLVPLDPQTLVPGEQRVIALRAVDPDGDRLDYTVRTAPGTNGVLTHRLESSAGQLIFSPQTTELGSFQLEVLVSDGTATTTQTITVQVVPDPTQTTRVAGRVLDVSEVPISGLLIEIGSIQTTTDELGHFLVDLGSGPPVSETLKVRGDLFVDPSQPQLQYPFVAEKLPFMFGRELFAGFNNVLPRPIYLPRLNPGTPVVPTNDIVIEAALRDTVEPVIVEVAAGSLLNQQGTPFTGNLSITEVPVERTPAALPPNLLPDFLITIQPGEMTFTTPAPLSFPNTGGWLPGTRMDLWSINPTTGEFEVVGEMTVSEDAKTIDTIEGGIRNSSWHFPAPPPPRPKEPEKQPENKDDKCKRKEDCKKATSSVATHSGAVLETHDLVPYQSQGLPRGLRLSYNSQHADPRPIIHFGFDNTIADEAQRLVARVTFTNGTWTQQLSGFAGGMGLPGGEHFWRIPAGGGPITVALQGDLRTMPSGFYQYRINSGLLRLNAGRFSGSMANSGGEIVHVNAIDSPLGAGWQIGDVQRLIRHANGAILLIEGNGLTLGFQPLPNEPRRYQSPAGDFSQLVRESDDSYRRTMPDQTIYHYAADGFLRSITDRNGNQVRHIYELDRLVKIIDPVGLETTFTYEGSHLRSITDPAGRVTRLEHDAAGNLTRITDPDGSSRQFTYDSEHRLIGEIDQQGAHEQTRYGFHGRAIGSVRKDGSTLQFNPLQTQVLLPLEATSNPFSAPIAPRSSPQAVVQTIDANGQIVNTMLDAAGQKITEQDTLGTMPREERNQQNLLSAWTDARGNRIDYSYDARGNLLSVSDALSSRAEIVRGEISVPGTTREFRFSLAADTQLYFDSLIENPSLRWHLSGPGGTLATDRPFVLRDWHGSIPAIAGDYRLQVDGIDDSVGSYQFRLLDLAAALPLTLGSSVLATFDPPRSAVTYQFAANEGERFFFDWPTNSTHYHWHVLDPDGQRLTWANSSEPVTMPRPGTYFLVIEHVQNETNSESPTARFGVYPIPGKNTEPWSGSSLSLNEAVIGDIATPGAEQSYLFTLNSSRQLLFDIQRVEGNLWWSLEGPAGLLVSRQSLTVDDWNSLDTVERMFTAVAGEYRLTVDGSGNATGAYRFILHDLAAAEGINPGIPVTATLDPASKAILYQFSASAGDQFFFDERSPAPVNANWRLVNPYGMTVFSQAFSDVETRTLASSGTHTLVVSGRGTADTSIEIGLNVQPAGRITPPAWTGDLLTLGQPVSGSLTIPGNMRSYLFTINADTQLYFDSLSAASGLHWTLEGPAGKLIDRAGFDDVFRSIPFVNTVAGDYRLTVAGWGDATGHFEFRFLDKQAATPITAGLAVNDSLLRADSTNLYQFAANAGERVYFDNLVEEYRGAFWRLVGPYGQVQFAAAHQYDAGTQLLDRTGIYTLLVEGAGSDSAAIPIGFTVHSVPVSPPSTIPLNTPIQGSIPSPGYQQTFDFTVETDRRLYFDSLLNSGGLSWTLRGPTGTLISQADFEDYNRTSPLLVAVAGRYRLTVAGNGDATGNFAFRILDANAATPITPGVPVQDSLSPASSTRLYQFTATAGDRFFFDKRINDHVYANWKLVDPYNRTRFSGWLADVETITVDRTGTYLLVVEGFSTSSGSIPIDFIIQSVRSSNPTPLVLDTPVQGALPTAGFEQDYVFSLDSRQQLYFDGWRGSDSGLRWTLNGPAGTLVDRAMFRHWGEGERTVFISAMPGNYRLTISGQGDATGDFQYRLLRQETAPFITPGEAVQGTLNPASSTAIYRFATNAGERFYFDWLSNNYVSANWKLIDPQGKTQWSDRVRDRATTTLDETGTYTLLIEGDHDASGTIPLAFTVQPVPSTASTVLTLNDLISGSLPTAGSERHYTFNLSAAKNLYFDSLSSQADVRWSLEGPAGMLAERLTFDDFGRRPFWAAVPGSYLLTISGQGDATGDFAFRLLDQAAATAITPGSPVSVLLEPSSSTSLYRLDATAGDRFSFDRLSPADQSFVAAFWRLVDPFGRVQFSTYLSDVTSVTLDRTGSYTLVIDGVAAGSSPLTAEFLVQPQGRETVTPWTGEGLVLGATVEGSIATPLSERSYVFTLDTDRFLYFDSLTNTYDLHWKLEGPSGTLASEALGSTLSRPVLAAVAGTYRLTIQGQGDRTGPYAFRLLDLATAAAQTPGTPVTSSLAPGNSTALFKFSATAGEQYYFDARTVGSVPAYWGLVDPYGALLFFDSFGDREPLTIPRTGTYTLFVDGYHGVETAIPFSFQLQAVAIDPPRTLVMGTTVRDQISTAGMKHVFTFSIDSDRTLYFDHLANSSHVSWKLEGPQGILANQTFSDHSSPILPAVAGAYQLTIDAIGDHTGNYAFRLLDLADAIPLSFGSPVTAILSPADLTAMYQFSAQAGDQLFFDTLGAATLNGWLLVDPFGRLLSRGYFGDQHLSILPRAGRYTLLLEGYASGAAEEQVRFAIHRVNSRPAEPLAIASTQGTRYGYDPTFNQVARVLDELGRITLFDIDSRTGNYNSVRRVLGKADHPNDPEPNDLVTHFTYTASGLLASQTDALGRVTRYEYDSLGRLTSVRQAAGTSLESQVQYEYDSIGNLTAEIDPSGYRTEFRYDTMNRLIQMVEPDPDGAGPLQAGVTTFGYDLRGNLTQTIDHEGNRFESRYDALDRPIETTDPLGNVAAFEYDHEGNLLLSRDPNGEVTRYEYDSRNRRTKQIDAMGGVTLFRYDLDDNLISVVDPEGNLTQFQYDARQRMVREIDPSGNETSYAYDAADNLIAKTDRNGRVTQYQYDPFDRLAFEYWLDADGQLVNTIRFQYDQLGNLLSVTDQSVTQAWNYDEQNRVIYFQQWLVGMPDITLSYSYDLRDNLLSTFDTISGQAGGRTEYDYDALNRVRSIRQSGSGVTPKLVDMVFDQLGQLSEISRYSDFVRGQLVARSRYQYDDLKRLVSLQHGSALSPREFAFYDFEYDAASRITALTDRDGRTTYGYDRTDQLTAAYRGATDPRGSEAYGYDANGNRLTSHMQNATAAYGVGNRLLADDRYDYTYDREGNLIRQTTRSLGAYRQFDYNHRNRLVRVTDYSASGQVLQQVEFTYDTSNRRLSRTIDSDGAGPAGSVTEYYVYDGEHVILEFVDADGLGSNSQPTLAYRNLFGPGIDMILAQQSMSDFETRWLLTDHLGTPRDIISNAGEILNHLTFDSYGNLLTQSNPLVSTRYAFTGREWDPDIEFYYYRARFYDAKQGRFISEDPIGFAAFDQNLYRYAFNQPGHYTDPSGEIPPALVAAAVGAAVGVAGYTVNTPSGEWSWRGAGVAAVAGAVPTPARWGWWQSGAVGAVVNVAAYVATEGEKSKFSGGVNAAIMGFLGGVIKKAKVETAGQKGGRDMIAEGVGNNQTVVRERKGAKQEVQNPGKKEGQKQSPSNAVQKPGPSKSGNSKNGGNQRNNRRDKQTRPPCK